jgi:endogenous inhibitor of DNA gyrase (YacG/DUF329 family)
MTIQPDPHAELLAQNLQSVSMAICALCRKSYERLSLSIKQGNYAPFCSRGCAARDQLNWLNGHYVIKDNGQLGNSDEEDMIDEQE